MIIDRREHFRARLYAGLSCQYNQHMEPSVFIDGHIPRRKLVISARKSIANETFRARPDHLDGSAARRDEAPAPLPSL
jgi:hypothetical protein